MARSSMRIRLTSLSSRSRRSQVWYPARSRHPCRHKRGRVLRPRRRALRLFVRIAPSWLHSRPIAPGAAAQTAPLQIRSPNLGILVIEAHCFTAVRAFEDFVRKQLSHSDRRDQFGRSARLGRPVEWLVHILRVGFPAQVEHMPSRLQDRLVHVGKPPETYCGPGRDRRRRPDKRSTDGPNRNPEPGS
jgi:hypothetical protein